VLTYHDLKPGDVVRRVGEGQKMCVEEVSHNAVFATARCCWFEKTRVPFLWVFWFTSWEFRRQRFRAEELELCPEQGV
jgi:uncharacterized protein YodC (DUF2158 family)